MISIVLTKVGSIAMLFAWIKNIKSALTLSVLCVSLSINAEDLNTSMNIAQFRALNATSGAYQVEGYVAKQYQCPPCPLDVQCKPCMRNNVLLAEVPESLELYPERGNYLIVFTEHPELLQKEVHYRVKLKVLTQKTTQHGGNDVELVSFERLPQPEDSFLKLTETKR